VPAASAVLLRDRPGGPEVLLLRRTRRASFGPGAWVFPGGRVDPGDLVGGPADDPTASDPTASDPVAAQLATGQLAAGHLAAGHLAAELAAARRAAARETSEEAGLTIDGAALTPLARWCPPVTAPRRFLTWMLLGRAPDQDVVVDGGEITDHRWVRPAQALHGRDQGELELMPPTWVTLWALAAHADVADALATAAAAPPELFETQFSQVPGGLLARWHGDEEYESTPAAPPGARHRLWMLDSGWRYERTG